MSVFYKNTPRVLSYDVLWQQKNGGYDQGGCVQGWGRPPLQRITSSPSQTLRRLVSLCGVLSMLLAVLAQFTLPFNPGVVSVLTCSLCLRPSSTGSRQLLLFAAVVSRRLSIILCLSAVMLCTLSNSVLSGPLKELTGSAPPGVV